MMCDSGKAVEKRILCLKESHPDVDDGRTSCIWRMDVKGNLETILDGAEPGDRIILDVVEMTEADLEALPEFEGW